LRSWLIGTGDDGMVDWEAIRIRRMSWIDALWKIAVTLNTTRYPDSMHTPQTTTLAVSRPSQMGYYSRSTASRLFPKSKSQRTPTNLLHLPKSTYISRHTDKYSASLLHRKIEPRYPRNRPRYPRPTRVPCTDYSP